MAQVEAHLGPELAEGARPGSIPFLDASLDDLPDEVQVLELLVPARRGGRELREEQGHAWERTTHDSEQRSHCADGRRVPRCDCESVESSRVSVESWGGQKSA